MMTAEIAAPTHETQPSPKLYRCCEDWEHSGYHDSDWFCVAYDPQADTLTRVETGTTRFACALNHTSVLSMPEEMMPRAMAALIRLHEKSLTAQENRAVMEPRIEDLTRGVRVRLLTASRCQAKRKTVVDGPCVKCDGSGKWVNPRRASDIRDCFACKGTGKAKRTRREKVKSEDGAVIWELIAADAPGVVLGQATFGTFYRSGYNSPGRSNTVVYLRLDDGREVQVKADKLRLDREPVSADEIRARAVRKAADFGFYPPFATAGVSMM